MLATQQFMKLPAIGSFIIQNLKSMAPKWYLSQTETSPRFNQTAATETTQSMHQAEIFFTLGEI